jgi:hypothetical protein
MDASTNTLGKLWTWLSLKPALSMLFTACFAGGAILDDAVVDFLGFFFGGEQLVTSSLPSSLPCMMAKRLTLRAEFSMLASKEIGLLGEQAEPCFPQQQLLWCRASPSRHLQFAYTVPPPSCVLLYNAASLVDASTSPLPASSVMQVQPPVSPASVDCGQNDRFLGGSSS